MTKVQAKKLQTLTGHTDAVYALQRGAQPHLFFSGAGDGLIVRWDLQNPATGDLIARLPNSVYALHLLPDSELLVAGHNYDGIHILDTAAKAERASLKTGDAAIFDIRSFGDDVFVASGDGIVTVVDQRTWTIRKRLAFSQKSARSMAVNPRQRELVVGYSDCFVRVFDLDTLELRHAWVAHENSVFTVCFDPGFATLITGSRDARLKSWDPLAGYGAKSQVVAHLYAINNVEFSPDGKHFVTCSLDKSIKVWEAGGMKLVKVIDKARHAGHGTSVNKLLWTSFDNSVVSASDDRTMSVWDLVFE